MTTSAIAQKPTLPRDVLAHLRRVRAGATQAGEGGFAAQLENTDAQSAARERTERERRERPRNTVNAGAATQHLTNPAMLGAQVNVATIAAAELQSSGEAARKPSESAEGEGAGGAGQAARAAGTADGARGAADSCGIDGQSEQSAATVTERGDAEMHAQGGRRTTSAQSANARDGDTEASVLKQEGVDSPGGSADGGSDLGEGDARAAAEAAARAVMAAMSAGTQATGGAGEATQASQRTEQAAGVAGASGVQGKALASAPKGPQLLDRLASAGQDAQEKVQQRMITDAATRAIAQAMKQGEGEVVLRLRPESLGSVQIRLQVQDAKVDATVQASNESARRLLEASVPTLTTALEAQGLTVQSLRVSLQRPEGAKGDAGAVGASRGARAMDGGVRVMNVRGARAEPGQGAQQGGAPLAGDDAVGEAQDALDGLWEWVA